MPDNLDKLLSDVRKTISDNRLFLERLVDEAPEEEPDKGSETEPAEEEEEEEEFEEL